MDVARPQQDFTESRRIGERIRQGRGLRGLSQGALGATLGISFQQIQKDERGTNRIAACALVTVAQALQLPMSFSLPGPVPAPAPEAVQAALHDHLRATLGTEKHGNFLGRLQIDELAGGVAVFSLPTPFLVMWAYQEYFEVLTHACEVAAPFIRMFAIQLRSSARPAPQRPAALVPPAVPIALLPPPVADATIPSSPSRSAVVGGASDGARQAFRPMARGPTAAVQDVVATSFGLTRADLLGPSRLAHIVRPRQIAMYLAREVVGQSLPEIGRRFGGRDHTTVLHAVRKIARLAVEDEMLGALVDELRDQVGERLAATSIAGSPAQMVCET